MDSGKVALLVTGAFMILFGIIGIIPEAYTSYLRWSNIASGVATEITPETLKWGQLWGLIFLVLGLIFLGLGLVGLAL